MPAVARPAPPPQRSPAPPPADQAPTVIALQPSTGQTPTVIALQPSTGRPPAVAARPAPPSNRIPLLPPQSDRYPAATPAPAVTPAPVGALVVAPPDRSAGLLYRLAKRTLDVAVAGGLLLLLAPLFAAVAVAVKLTSRGPVFFAQWRVGEGATEFRFFKFRSMVVNAEEQKAHLSRWNDHQDSVTFKMKKDPRLTRVGKFIRRFSIDELPQLWNVLKGDMSLVGPRPAVPGEVAMYTAHDMKRLAVPPGLTCIWQVSGRGDLPFDKQVALDIQYIRRRSLWLDLTLLAKTVPAVFSGRGAY